MGLRSSVILILSLLPILLLSQRTLTATGTVVDGESGWPLVGVIVQHSFGVGTHTDVDGRFTFTSEEDSYTLTFRYVGYEDKEVTFNAQSEQGAEIRMTPLTLLLDQVVVTAGRFEQRQSEVTVSMEVIRPELIRNKVVTSMDQVLQETPGMIIVDSEPQIRSGSGYSFGAGSRVQILVDGIPQLSGDAGRPIWGNLPLETVEQIEVIKGASSVLYGSAALSGVINIRTSFPKEKSRTAISTYMGAYSAPRSESAHYWRGNNTLSGQQISQVSRLGEKQNVGLVVGLMALSDDGHLGPIIDSTGAEVYGQSLDAPSHYEVERRLRGNVGLRVKNTKVEGLQYGVNLNALKGNSVSTLLWEDTEAGFYRSFGGAATTTRQEVSNVNPFIEYFSAKGSHAILRGNWQQLDNDNDNGQANFSDTYFIEGQYQFDLDGLAVENTKVTIGLSRLWASSDSPLFSDGGNDYTHESSNEGAYLQVDKRLIERLNLSAGMRYERFGIDGIGESRPVFRAGANYQLGEVTFLRGSFGQGFRFPSIGEKFLTTTVGVVAIYPNTELRSESSTNLEFGLKQGFALGEFRGYIDLAAFEQHFDGYIEFTFGQWADTASFDNLLGLGFTSLNTGEARVRGLELSLAARGALSEKCSLSILGGYTYTVPVSLDPALVYGVSTTEGTRLDGVRTVSYSNTSSDPTDDILKYRMQHIARLNADLTVGRLSIGGGVRYNSFMQNIDKVFIQLDEGTDLPRLLPSGISEFRKENDKGDAVVDARISFQGNGIYRLGLVVNNLFHREYSIRPLDLAPTRNLILKLDITI